MKRFLAIQNIIELKRQLDSEAAPSRRAIIERLILDEEAVLLLKPHKLSGKIPFLSPSPDVCGGPTPRLAPSSGPRWNHMAATEPEFDHRRCPNCDVAMRLVYVQPREMHRDDGYDLHHYRCAVCSNESRFVLERNSNEGLARSTAPKSKAISENPSIARRAIRSVWPSLRRT